MCVVQRIVKEVKKVKPSFLGSSPLHKNVNFTLCWSNAQDQLPYFTVPLSRWPNPKIPPLPHHNHTCEHFK
jgi:hypothetical protein